MKDDDKVAKTLRSKLLAHALSGACIWSASVHHPVSAVAKAQACCQKDVLLGAYRAGAMHASDTASAL